MIWKSKLHEELLWSPSPHNHGAYKCSILACRFSHCRPRGFLRQKYLTSAELYAMLGTLRLNASRRLNLANIYNGELSRANRIALRPISPSISLYGQPRIAGAVRSYASTAQQQQQQQQQQQHQQQAPKLSLGLRIRRAASFTFYTGLVLGGIGLTGIVVYYFVKDVLLPTSDARVFNRALAIVRKDEKSANILGGGRLKAYGEQTDNKWARSRPIASRRGFDGHGREHLIMQFHVEGELASGLVRLEMIESEEKSKTGIGKYDFRYLVLEVPGHPRHYIIDNSEKPRKKDTSAGFLGVRWGKPKSDE